MSEINISVIETRIVDLQARVDVKSDTINLQASMSAQSKRPIDKDDKSGLMWLQAVISAENKDEFYFSLTEEMVFSFNTKPEDFDEIMKNKCVPIALNDVSEKIDSILLTMGHSAINMFSHAPL